jgi:Family of unknown function (DUF6496)
MPSSAVFDKFGAGKLHSGGPNGPVVHNRKQAIAIKMSEQRKEDANGGVYPEKHAAGGPVMTKGEGAHDAQYASGGAVLPRTGDWKKTVPNRGFLDTPDRFTSGRKVQGAPGSEMTSETWGKGSKPVPKAVDKSERPVKPRS